MERDNKGGYETERELRLGYSECSRVNREAGSENKEKDGGMGYVSRWIGKEVEQAEQECTVLGSMYWQDFGSYIRLSTQVVATNNSFKLR